MVQQNILHIDIHIFALLVFAAAVLGDSVGYSFTYKVKSKRLKKENSRFFKKKHLEQTESFMTSTAQRQSSWLDLYQL
ncbi:DedA family protein [Candidatus Minimicrobia naudis]